MFDPIEKRRKTGNNFKGDVDKNMEGINTLHRGMILQPSVMSEKEKLECSVSTVSKIKEGQYSVVTLFENQIRQFEI